MGPVKKKALKREVKRLQRRERDLLNENLTLDMEVIFATQNAEDLFDALQEAWTEITRLKRAAHSHWVDDIEWELNQED